MGFNFFLKAGPATDAVDSFVPSCLNDPGARKLGNAGIAPLVDGDREGLLGRLFRKIEVAEMPNQCGDDSSPIGTIH